MVYQVNGSRVEWNPCVPGTNPFFPRDMADMGNRMLELLDGHEVQAFVLNTERGGGGDDHPGSKKVTIPCSSAIVAGIVEGTIEWTEDPDFGYDVAAVVPGVDGIEILQPRRRYDRQGRGGEHAAMVAGSSGSGRNSSAPSRAWTNPWSNRWGYRGENRRGEGRRELRLLTGAFPTLGTLAVTTTVMRKAAAWELVTWSTGCTSAGSQRPCRPAPSRATSG